MEKPDGDVMIDLRITILLFFSFSTYFMFDVFETEIVQNWPV